VGLLRGLQLIVFSSLVDAPYPAEITIIMQNLAQVAQADILDGEWIYNLFFTFLETRSLTKRYEDFGMGMNFLLNSGSFFIIVMGVLVFGVFKRILN
jgi:hypothetical protein